MSHGPQHGYGFDVSKFISGHNFASVAAAAESVRAVELDVSRFDSFQLDPSFVGRVQYGLSSYAAALASPDTRRVAGRAHDFMTEVGRSFVASRAMESLEAFSVKEPNRQSRSSLGNWSRSTAGFRRPSRALSCRS
ncbi:hypothetical protein FB385_3169 [Paramicrobacterium agarici]|nr:hypothetical protein FB385_3169 [Microbacterium agarici]